MEIFVICIYMGFAMAVGTWNYNKGNSFWLGFIISTLFTPLIGFIIVLFLKVNKENLEKRAIKSGKLKKCPSCAELIRAEAIKCKFCGADIQ